MSPARRCMRLAWSLAALVKGHDRNDTTSNGLDIKGNHRKKYAAMEPYDRARSPLYRRRRWSSPLAAVTALAAVATTGCGIRTAPAPTAPLTVRGSAGSTQHDDPSALSA